MFVENKYTRWYNSIIKKAALRMHLNEYVEQHHIIPKCLGGSNEKSNLVKLTAREHFVCHWLLTKMVPLHEQFHRKLIYAFWRLANNKNSKRKYTATSKVYATLKIQMAQAQSLERKGIWPGPNLGKPMAESTKEKLRNKVVSQETKQKIKAARAKQDTGHLKGREISQEWREKLSKANLGKKRSAESRAKQAATMIATRKTCEHCGCLVSATVYTRNHGEKCKLLNTTNNVGLKQ